VTRVTRRFVEDESGMTMALTVIMIVLIGVMGAGLLTFVSTDLNAVVEVNRGQRAFEMADAGVQAAQQQLRADPAANHYDGTTLVDVDDVRWAKSKGGMILSDLDGSATTADEVSVTIESLGSPDGPFRVMSVGEYGDARRVIEAIIESTQAVNLSRSL